MLKPKVWNNVFTPPWRALRLLLFALVIISITSGVGELKKTQGQSSSTCNITYQENTFWNVGFQGQVTIMNSGPAINGWTVTFTFPVATQTIYELWNGVYTQSGQNVTVTNASYNANIPTGGSVSFGFNANWSGSHPAPTGLTLNGQSCGGGGGGPVIQTSVTTLNVNEGGSAQFGVRLSSAPASNVTVNVARLSGDTDLSVSGGATLTFTPTNFGTFQNVTISAAEDADSTNGSAIFRVSSTGLANVDVTANEVDNDPAAIAIQTSVTTLNVNEGASAQFGVRLASAPTSNVTVNVARLSGDTDLSVTAGATLTFTPANFGTFQNVTISAAEDADLTNGSAVFRASGAGLTSADVTATEVDNDTPIQILTNLVRPPLVAIENDSAQIGLRLASAPSANVTVTVTRVSGDADLKVVLPGTVTFTPTDFATFKNVTISAAEDADITNGTAVFRASGTNLTSADFNVSEFDNDGLPVAQRTFIAPLNGASEAPPVVTPGTGTATVILSPDETAALVSLNWTGLSSPESAAHLHAPAPPGNNAGVVLDLDMPPGQISNMLWVFQPSGGLTVQGLIDALKGGQMYANVHSANNPTGEIRGWLFVVDDGDGGGGGGAGGGFADAARFLEQATFGPTVAEANRVLSIGFDAWLNEQFAAPITGYNNLVQLQQGTFVNYPVKLQFFRNAMTGTDQLRQRVAWALSQIVVAANVGDQDTTGNPTAMVSQYHDILLRNAFGNYRTLLREISVSPIMGTYLTLVNSQKANTATNTQPDENYARELWQLFAIGTFRLNPDGTVMLDGQGRPLETYTIAEIQESARALTGWNYAPAAGQPNMGNNNPLNPFAPMITNPANHDTGSKTLLKALVTDPQGQVIPANQTVDQDLDSVINNAFNHPNVGPFIGRHLIQHLVTSNPSPAYVQRITTVFNNNGQGVRGDLRAVVRAILLDPEARGNSKTDPAYGKLREPAIFFTHLFRSLNCTGGMWGIPQRSRRQGQDVFSPPSVFSYYQPDFRVVVNGQSIFAPPAQILTTSTLIERFNLLNEFLFAPPIQPGGDPNPTGSPTTSVVFDFAPFDQLAPNPTNLVNELDTRLTHGSMSPQMRQTVIDAVTSIQNNNRLRVQTAIYIIASSMQYQVQR